MDSEDRLGNPLVGRALMLNGFLWGARSLFAIDSGAWRFCVAVIVIGLLMEIAGRILWPIRHLGVGANIYEDD